MEDAASKFEACRKWGRPVTITYGEGPEGQGPQELVASIESVTGGVVVFELLSDKGLTAVPIDDVHDIVYPPLRKVRDGVFEVVRNSGPIC